MSSIHYRFRSSSEFETIHFDGPSITVSDLREAIMQQKKIAKTPGHTLEITNAQTKEVYEVDSNMVPKNSSVIVKRVPVQRLEAVTAATSGLSKEEEELTEIAFAKLSKTADLVNAKASENDKIKAMMTQSTADFNPSTYARRAPPNYPCYRCDGRGHFIKDCPTQGDPRYNNAQFAPRQPSGIPRAYYMMNMMRLKQEEEFIKNLRAMQPANSRFSPVCSSDVVDHSKIPSELQCPMCKKLFTDVVVTPCCGFSYCDECIRNYLVEHELVCVCQETTSPDNLIANKSLRISVSNFRNKKNAEMKSVPPSPVMTGPRQSLITPAPVVPNEIITQPVSLEPAAIQLQQPPDLQSENSQGSMSNGLTGTESGQDSDTGCVNSPKKAVMEVPADTTNLQLSDVIPGSTQSPVISHQVVVPPNPQVVTSLPVTQPTLITSQMMPRSFPASATQAIYSGVQTAIRPGLLLSQQRHMVPGAVVAPVPYGLSIPPGARIVKRLVPVPVGPRLPHNQIRLPQPGHALVAPSGNLNPRMIDPSRIPPELVKINQKRHGGNDAESPVMPMTEDEFYQWQQDFKKRTGPARRRQHRSPSHEGSRERFRSRSPSRSRSRSRSRSPAEKKRRYRKEEDDVSSPRRSKKKHDSADDSSLERQKKKEKLKKRHRDTSQESGKSDLSKPRTRVDKKTKSRELPEHIKREVDEFEFDNELEFDEELRKLRKESKQKKKSVDVELSSPEDFKKIDQSTRSRSSSFSKLSRTPSPDVKPIDIDDNDDVNHSLGVNKIEKGSASHVNVDEKSATVAPSEKDKNNESLDNGITNTTGEEHHVQKLDNGEVSSTLNSPSTEVKPVESRPKKKTKIIKKKVIRIIKVARKKQKSTSNPEDVAIVSTPETPTGPAITVDSQISVEVPEIIDDVTSEKIEKVEESAKSGVNDSVMEIPPPVPQENELELDDSVIITDQPLPENSRWETSGHRSKTNDGSGKKSKVVNIEIGDKPKTDKKKTRKEHSDKLPDKSDISKVKSTVSKEKILALKQMHAHKSKVISAEVRAKKEAEKRAFIEKAKRSTTERPKSDGKDSNTDDDERRRKREKYLLLKTKRAKERAIAERQRLKKLEAESDTAKPKLKNKKNETDHSEDHATMDDDKSRPADAKLKTISEISKKRLQQSEVGEPKKNEIEDESSDVLKSKVTSLKTVIEAAEKRRVIKTSLSEEERELTTPLIPEEQHVRRVVKIDDRKKSLVSKVEKLSSSSEKGITIRPDHEKRRHRDEELERRRREKSIEREREEAIERDRYERRVRMREEDNLRREMKEKIRLREAEKLWEKEEQQRVKSLEKEKLEGLERERQALKEKEKLERKLKRERQLREEMVREKEEKEEKDRKKDADQKRQDKRKVTVPSKNDSGNSDDQNVSKKGKRDKTKPGYIIQIIDSDKSDSDSDSSEEGDREKKKKKRKKKKEKKKKRKKVEDSKSEEKDNSEETSEEEERKKKKKKKDESNDSSDEDEDRKKKKRKKHKKKHKKHRKVKKTKKKSKKKKSKKERSESESDDKQVEESGAEDSGEGSATESTKEEKSSSSSDGESAASSAEDKKGNEEETSRTEDVSTGSENRIKSKEKPSTIREELSKGKPDSPAIEHDNRLKEKSEVSRSARDSRSKEKSGTPHSERDSRSKEKVIRSERDSGTREKTESVKSNRTKNKSDVLRVEDGDRAVDTSHNLHDGIEKRQGKSRNSRPIRSKSRPNELRTERDNNSKEKSNARSKESTPTPTSSNKELSNDRVSTRNSNGCKNDRVPNVSPRKRVDTTVDELELDYNEDIGDLDDDVLYGDLDFADDEQINPVVAGEGKSESNKTDEYEDGEILDEELFSAGRKNKKSNDSLEADTDVENSDGRINNVDEVNKETNSTESNDIELAIENAVDDAINELSLEIECDSDIESPKAKRTKPIEKDSTRVPKRVLRKR